MGQGNAAYEFCENFLKDLILKNVDEQLTCTELLHDLRVHCGEMFRDIKSIQASVMIDLYRENQFEKYIEYIKDYESCMKEKMDEESREHFTGKKRLESVAKVKLGQVIYTILHALHKTTESVSNGKAFIKTFIDRLEHFKIEQSEIGAYLELEVASPKQFSAIVAEQLQEPVHEDISKNISSWDAAKKVDEKGLVEFLFTELVGCTARCAFCKVPCDAHSGGKREGNHSAILHRPQGLGEFRIISTQILMTTDCCSDVASRRQFRHYSGDQAIFTPYKIYHTVYPEWTIHGNADPYVEKYWKFVFAQHNEKFAEYYTAKEADIPEEWSRFSKEDIIQDIEENYHITVDMANI